MKKISSFLLFCTLSTFISAQGFSSIQQRKLTNALTAISNLYVDSINDKKIVESTLTAILKELDPHSSYIPKEEVDRVNEPLEGSFEGVGIQFQLFNDTLLVVQTIAGCPAAKVGILPSDRIIYIGEKLVAGVKMQSSDIMKGLRGPKGSEVIVKILRGGKPNLITFKIIRDKIPIYSVDATYMVTNNIGYIKINSFGSTTSTEFRKALSKLKEKGMKNLVLSLQSNGGGYLNAAIELVDEFLGSDRLIVYTQGLNQPKTTAESTKIGNFESGKVIVLIDEYSASASEIVSGALQDWDRAIIVGRRSFGKGLVQRQFPLIDGSLMRLTTARYYTPTGRCIQKSYKDGKDKYETELITRYNNGELFEKDSIHFPDSLKYQTLGLKRTVYGGGGIMPDLFVPIDTTKFTDYHRNIVANGIVNKFMIQYIEKYRTSLKKQYPNFEKYKKEFVVDETIFNQLITMVEKEKIKNDSIHNAKKPTAITDKTLSDTDLIAKKNQIAVEKEKAAEKEKIQIGKSKELIKLQLKAIIARDLWEMNEYYQIMDADNESLTKALEILQTPGRYESILK